MTSTVKSVALKGIDGYFVTVEADCLKGIPSFDIVGMAGQAVKEATRRVRSAYSNAIGDFQKGRITVNLAPADTEKEASALDLPIFIAVCGAFGLLENMLQDTVFIGELSLSGELREIGGVLAYTAFAAENGIKRIVLPECCADEAALIPGIDVIGIKDVGQLISYLKGEISVLPRVSDLGNLLEDEALPDFAEVRGHYFAKRALEIAAAGGHNIALIGPPGSGKSMLAKRLPSIMPPLDREEVVEVTKIWSVAGRAQGKLIQAPPFRSPHHTVSPVGLSGGGSVPRPGEISLAHHGVLFLDEWPEFSKSTLEILRQPIEDKQITISRAAQSSTFPADFILVCAANPCKCGNFGTDRKCTCSPRERRMYMSHISGPLLDRMDLMIEVPPVPLSDLENKMAEEPSSSILKRVIEARVRQKARLDPYGMKLNSQMTHDMITKLCCLTDGAKDLVTKAFDFYGLTARSYDRLLKTAQTVADLEGKEEIDELIIAEVISYRTAEKKYFFRG